MIIAEGPIDVLSIACLEHRKHKKGFFTTHKIATCGFPHKSIAERIKKISPKKVVLAMDMDEAGEKMTTFLKENLSNFFPVSQVTFDANDPNDLLKKILNKK